MGYRSGVCNFASNFLKGEFYLFVSANAYEGIPSRLYRTPSEIKRDISRVRTQLEEIGEMLSIHNLLINLVSEFATSEPKKWIPELEETVAEAKDALEKARELEELLNDLSAELREARWASAV